MDGLQLFFWLCVALSILSFLAFLVTMIMWRVPTLVDELSGRAKRERVKEIQRMYTKNAGGTIGSTTGTGSMRTTSNMSKYFARTEGRYSEPKFKPIDEAVKQKNLENSRKNVENIRNSFNKISDNPNLVDIDDDTYDDSQMGTNSVNKEAINNMFRTKGMSVISEWNESQPHQYAPDEVPTGYLNEDIYGNAYYNNQSQQNGYVNKYSQEEQPTGYLPENQGNMWGNEEQPTGYLPENQDNMWGNDEQPTGYLPENQDNTWGADEQPTGYLPENQANTWGNEEQPTGYLNNNTVWTNIEEASTNHSNDATYQNTNNIYENSAVNDIMQDETLTTDYLNAQWDAFESESLPSTLLNDSSYDIANDVMSGVIYMEESQEKDNSINRAIKNFNRDFSNGTYASEDSNYMSALDNITSNYANNAYRKHTIVLEDSIGSEV